MLRVAKGSGGGGSGGGWANSVRVDVAFMWMFEQVMHAPCGEGFRGGGGSGGGWANSVRVDVAFMWMLHSCGCLNRLCMLRMW